MAKKTKTLSERVVTLEKEITKLKSQAAKTSVGDTASKSIMKKWLAAEPAGAK